MIVETINTHKFKKVDGVYILTEIKNQFEKDYLKVREKENRLYTDDEVKSLPFTTENITHKDEWKLREKSFLRFKEYLTSKKENLNILDLGCGNGWFCGQLSKHFNNSFYCADVNMNELKQAARVFNTDNIKYVYADIFNTEIRQENIDLIIINAAIQYFPDFKRLINKLLTLIRENGEIHIMDSPLYSNDEVENAKERTRVYFSSIGFPQMTDRYFHHTFSELDDFNYTILYEPLSVRKKIKRLITSKDSPFHWILITK